MCDTAAGGERRVEQSPAICGPNKRGRFLQSPALQYLAFCASLAIQPKIHGPESGHLDNTNPTRKF
jgi:hypothetical protein